MKLGGRFALPAALALFGAVVSAALAGAYDEVYGDYEKDGRLTACFHSTATLDQALEETPTDTEQYNPDFRETVTAERNRVRGGRCGTDGGAAARLRIRSVRANPAGPAVAGAERERASSLREEYVAVTNAGGAKVRLKGWGVSNARGRFYGFRRGALRPGRTLRLRSGRGRDGGGQVYWGSAREMWPNRGGIAKLWAPGRRRVQELRYGSFR